MSVEEKSRVITILLRDYMGGVYYNSLNLAGLLAKAGRRTNFILTDQTDRPSGAPIKDLSDFDSQTFFFSSTDNKHYLFRKLARMIPDDSDVLILNDFLEYKLVTHRRFSQKVIGMVHGDYDYYYDLAVASESRIDHFACISETITQKLKTLLPHRISDIVFIPALVPDIQVEKAENDGDQLRIAFVGRLTPEKGFDLLPEIDSGLRLLGVSPRWTIIAPHTTLLYDEWLNLPDVVYHDRVDNKDMAGIYARQDVLLLPSHAEGFPLSILEAMKCGVVPLATDLPTLRGTLIRNGENGYMFPINDVPAITGILTRLGADNILLRQMAASAKEFATAHYNEATLAKKWTELLDRVGSGKDPEKPITSIYDRMDLSWLPNAVTKGLRRLRTGRQGQNN